MLTMPPLNEVVPTANPPLKKVLPETSKAVIEVVANVVVPVTVKSLVVKLAMVVVEINACLKYLPAEPMS